jgi:hypothetical protein
MQGKLSGWMQLFRGLPFFVVWGIRNAGRSTEGRKFPSNGESEIDYFVERSTIIS